VSDCIMLPCVKRITVKPRLIYSTHSLQANS
jgi:hypothetical protein